MQKSIRINETQLLYLSSKAREENTLQGYLYKKSTDTGKWQLRWFALYQNLLFYYESESCQRPSGMALLEGSFCEKVITPAKGKEALGDKQFCFAIFYRKEGQRQYELRAENEADGQMWMDAILKASFSKVLELKQQVEQKHLHLLQVLDSERQAKWYYVQQTEEFASEVANLEREIREYKEESRAARNNELESEELKKIKKVQSFFRGWLCRRRWKQIVELYIRSEHAESMRKRNSIVFKMVESEEEYVKQLSTLVSVFLRPFRMSASSKVPPVSHDDVNSIFLNSETLLFLHQIFLKGLMARMENWPTIVLDLFDMLLPMLGIYQEYVRNHHYSLQVLAECKQKPAFNQLLQRCEEKPVCEGRSLATFLTYSMHQVPRYIITIHELLAHTPHDHVERKSLEFALGRLEELSQIMQDEVSETENIRKNLAIERMIVEGCDILLDVNQTFVRQGSLVQIINDKNKSTLGRLGAPFKETKKETVRQVYLFTYHLMLTTRASNGRLHLVKNFGKIPLIDCTLIEEPWADDDDSSSYDSNLSLASQTSAQPTPSEYNNLDFRILVESRNGPPMTVNLVASTMQEKSAWCSDISQCIENLHYNELLYCTLSDSSSVTLPQSMRCDPKLFKDDVDIKFSRSLNSCKVPQIRHASVDRLLDRLTDLRFLSIDFLNTFLLTYRVFTTGSMVVEALRNVYRNPECGNLDSIHSPAQGTNRQSSDNDDSNESSPLSGEGAPESYRSQYEICPQAQHRVSVASKQSRKTSLRSEGQKKGVTFEDDPTQKIEYHKTFQAYDQQEFETLKSDGFLLPRPPKLAPIASFETLSESIDLQLDDLGEFDVKGETKAKDDLVTQRPFKEQVIKAGLMPTTNLQHAVSVPEIVGIDEDGICVASKRASSPFHNAMSLLNIPEKSCSMVRGSSSTLVPSPQSPGRDERRMSGQEDKKKWKSSLNNLELKIIFDKFPSEERDNSARNRLIGAIPPSVSPLYASRSHHLRNNVLTPSCDKNMSVISPHRLQKSQEFFYTSTTRMHHQIDALALSPASSPTYGRSSSFNLLRRPRSTSPCFFDWHDIAEPSLVLDEVDQTSAGVTIKQSEETFQKDGNEFTYGGTDSSTSDEGDVCGVKKLYEDVSTTSSSVTIQSSKLSIVSLTKTIQHFATQLLPSSSPSKNGQAKIALQSLETSAPRSVETHVPTRKISKIEISPATAFIQVPGPLKAVGPCTHPRSASTSAASGKPQKQPPKVGGSHSKRESMPNMPSSSYHPQHHYTCCRHHRQSLATTPIHPKESRQCSISIKPRAAKYSISELDQPPCCLSARSSSCATVPEGLAPQTKAGIVVTSSRASKRRSSSTAAAVAFAVATAGSASIKEYTLRSLGLYPGQNAAELKQFIASRKRESVISTFATLRVLNVLRQWVTKHYKDFEMDRDLKENVNELLEEMMANSNLLPVEYKIANAVSMALNKEEAQPNQRETLAMILTPPEELSEDSFDTLAALDVAEQMTYLDHKIFMNISVEELLGQAWMKLEKSSKAQNVLLVTRRFNEASRLVVSEIIRRQTVAERVACIEKWAAIADICRCINNFNGVLQICAAFVNSSIYRLRKTWEKVPKQTKQMIDKLQNLVSADGRFKNMRDALHRCDPPCIPYLGIYLTDLSFIEEGTPNTTDNGLVNFSKMRMIAHVIQEIESFQQTPYKIEFQQRVANYLLDSRRLIEDDQTFKFSLQIEPRPIRMSIPGLSLLG